MRRHLCFLVFGCISLSLATLGRAQNDRKPPTIADQQPTGGIDAVMAYAAAEAEGD